MPWPFSTPASGPTSFAGPGAAVPTSPTEIASGTTYLLGVHLTNRSSGARIVTFVTSADALLAEVTLPPGAEQPYEWPFRPTPGVKWSADGTQVVGHAWGY